MWASYEIPKFSQKYVKFDYIINNSLKLKRCSIPVFKDIFHVTMATRLMFLNFLDKIV